MGSGEVIDLTGSDEEPEYQTISDGEGTSSRGQPRPSSQTLAAKGLAAAIASSSPRIKLSPKSPAQPPRLFTAQVQTHPNLPAVGPAPMREHLPWSPRKESSSSRLVSESPPPQPFRLPWFPIPPNFVSPNLSSQEDDPGSDEALTSKSRDFPSPRPVIPDPANPTTVSGIERQTLAFGHAPNIEAPELSPRGIMAASKAQTVTEEDSPEVSLRNYMQAVQQRIHNDHAQHVRDLLAFPWEKSPMAALQTVDVDPWANIQPIESRANQPKVAVNHYKLNNKQTRESVPAIPLSVEATVVPRHKSYTHIERSFIAGNMKVMKSTPYFGDTEGQEAINRAAWIREYEKAHDLGKKDMRALRIAEASSKIKPYLGQLLRNQKPTKSFLKSNEGKRTALVFEDVFHFPLEKLLSREASSSQSSAEPSAENIISSYIDLGCMLCGSHQCQIHGTIDPSRDTNDKLINMSFQESKELALARRRLHGQKSITESELIPGSEPCSTECFINAARSAAFLNWSAEDSKLLEVLLITLGDDPRASCAIAPSFGIISCQDVAQKIRKTFKRLTTLPETAPKAKEKPLPWYNNQTKTIVEDNFGDYTNDWAQESRKQPSGCSHTGMSCEEAGEDCACFTAKILCERYCACPPNCLMRFTGCSCGLSGRPCSSTKCVCIDLNRECTPGLCSSCAYETASSVTGPPTGCHNMCIQMGRKSQVLCGVAEHGMGLFAAEFIKKNSYIDEYVGEIISYEESDRRSYLENVNLLSYQFTLNATHIIDAGKYGNLTRFINHNISPYFNCAPKVKLVEMEHRIGFFAVKDISPGTELFFDYGPDYASKYNLKGGATKDGDKVSKKNYQKGEARMAKAKAKSHARSARKGGGSNEKVADETQEGKLMTLEGESSIDELSVSDYDSSPWDDSELLTFDDLGIPPLPASSGDEFSPKKRKERGKGERPAGRGKIGQGTHTRMGPV